MNTLRLVILCGGPSPERGISLNSARSAYDHLVSESVAVEVVYFDREKRAYLISPAQLYSNTPSDFDFKLATSATKLSEGALVKRLKGADLIFPIMHGAFGEDGEIQTFLEKHRLPYVGSSSAACRSCFDKFRANETIKDAGFFALPSMAIDAKGGVKRGDLARFFKSNNISRAVVKPANGGSSIGVFSVASVEEAAATAKKLLAGGYRRLVVEPFCEGREFTVVILQNRFGAPVALFPIEIEADYSQHQIFDYRKKYLPTRQVTYHCPPRFSAEVTKAIRAQAAQLFGLFGMNDFARFDGWVLKDGSIWFSDFNPISGMEQNSFLFLQAAQIGMSHRDALRFVLESACRRHALPLSLPAPKDAALDTRREVAVLFGGASAERQVSLMSGTNVWLKLRRSKRYRPVPYMLDTNGAVWKLPYANTLNHTVEEIMQACIDAPKIDGKVRTLREQVLSELAPRHGQVNEEIFLPQKMSLKDFIKRSKCVFNTVHGGIGEDGTLQKLFAKARLTYNGCGAKASKLCMDKYETALKLLELGDLGIYTARKILLDTKSFSKLSEHEHEELWHEMTHSFEAPGFLAKPPSDGCSAGIALLSSSEELREYMRLLSAGVARIPAGTFQRQRGIIEMPAKVPHTMMFEEYIGTDEIQVVGNKLKRKKVTGWIEVTVGVLGRSGEMRALSPSITVASGAVLSVEEKFQGGTGINITPPPRAIVSDKFLRLAQQRIELVALRLGLEGYARIDAFLETNSGRIIVIEANTLPALTPSTVLFHQGLAAKPPLYPRELLEEILRFAEER